MKKITSISFVFMALLALVAFKPSNNELSAAFAETVTNLNKEDKMLREYVKGNGIMVVFSCNTCPFVINWEDRYAGLAEYAAANNIGFVLVNSNQAKRDGDDSFVAMKAHAEEKGYNFPYVMDHNSTIANMLSAKTTPHVYVFNNNLQLHYKGAIDDNNKDASAVKHTWAMDALKSLAKGKPANPAQTDALGCSIKRVKK
jgi:hypothetical protein